MAQRISVVLLMCLVLAASGCDALAPKTKRVVKTADKEKIAVAAQSAPEAKAPAATTAPAVEALSQDVVAKVGDWTLTVVDLNKRLEALKGAIKDFDPANMQARAMVVDELVRQQLLVQAARAEKMDESAELKAALKDFENNLLGQEMAAKVLKDIKVTEVEARDFYVANASKFVSPVERQLREIVLPSQAEAKDILVQVLQGADFSQLAKDKSKSASAANGGDLGFVPQAPFEAMQKAVDTLKKGDVSAVFEGPAGFYIVKVEDMRGGVQETFEAVKVDLINYLTQQKQNETLMNKLNEIAEKIKPQVNEALFKQ